MTCTSAVSYPPLPPWILRHLPVLKGRIRRCWSMLRDAFWDAAHLAPSPLTHAVAVGAACCLGRFSKLKPRRGDQVWLSTAGLQARSRGYRGVCRAARAQAEARKAGVKPCKLKGIGRVEP